MLRRTVKLQRKISMKASGMTGLIETENRISCREVGTLMKRTPLRKMNLKLFLCLLPLLLAMPALAQDQDQGAPPGRVARLSYKSGSVSFQPSGENQWSDAPDNYTLTTGDR